MALSQYLLLSPVESPKDELNKSETDLSKSLEESSSLSVDSSAMSQFSTSMPALPHNIEIEASPYKFGDIKPILKNRANRDWLEVGCILKGGKPDAQMTVLIDRLLQVCRMKGDPFLTLEKKNFFNRSDHVFQRPKNHRVKTEESSLTRPSKSSSPLTRASTAANPIPRRHSFT